MVVFGSKEVRFAAAIDQNMIPLEAMRFVNKMDSNYYWLHKRKKNLPGQKTLDTWLIAMGNSQVPFRGEMWYKWRPLPGYPELPITRYAWSPWSFGCKYFNDVRGLFDHGSVTANAPTSRWPRLRGSWPLAFLGLLTLCHAQLPSTKQIPWHMRLGSIPDIPAAGRMQRCQDLYLHNCSRSI